MSRAALGLCATAGAATLVAAVAAGCADPPAGPTPPVSSRQTLDRGAVALREYGCGSCHRIPGIASADGIVGPPLVDMDRRVYVGRGLPNTARNMARWIRTPQQFAPGSAMPDMSVSEADAAAIAAWLLHRD